MNDSRARAGERGFTLIEVTVVMGLLAILLSALVQITGQGAELWRRGESGQDLADRGLAAARVARDAIERVAGPRPGWRGEDGQARLPDARFVLHGGNVLRSTVVLAPDREDELLATAVAAFLARTEGIQVPDEMLQEQIAAWPRRGRGEVIVLPWPADASGVFLDLRVGERLADPELQAPGERGVVELATAEELVLDPEFVLANTRVVASGLLHFGVECWSQRTASWANASGQGSESSWDSARAGLLVPVGEGAPGFALDIGPESLVDPRDDVWPRWLRVTLVVSRGRDVPPEAYLAQPLLQNDQHLVVTRADELPGTGESEWLKVDTEWVRFGDIAGENVGGLRRGGRGTTAKDHARGAAVRVGREVVLHLPLGAGREADG